MIEVLDDQQAQDHLRRRGVPAAAGGLGVPPDQISLHEREERLVFQQSVQRAQHRVGLPRQLRHPREHVLGRVAIDQHRPSSTRWTMHSIRFLGPILPRHQRRVGSIPQQQLVLL